MGRIILDLNKFQLSEKDIKRFESKIERTNDCWLWKASTRGLGYGQFSFAHPIRGRINANAHRIAFTLWRTPIPPNLIVCHHCDNPKCVNPDHLFLGTVKDNMQDCVRKGRACKDGCPPGEQHPKAKLKVDDVLFIRAQNKLGVGYKKLAKALGVNKKTVQAIITGRTWKQVTT